MCKYSICQLVNYVKFFLVWYPVMGNLCVTLSWKRFVCWFDTVFTLMSSLELAKFYDLTLLPFFLRITKKVKEPSRTLLEDIFCCEDSNVWYYTRHSERRWCQRFVFFEELLFLHSSILVSFYSIFFLKITMKFLCFKVFWPTGLNVS